MSIQITVGWKNRLYDGCVSLWPCIRLTPKRLLKRITDLYLSVTRPCRRFCQRRIARIAQERRLFASVPDLPSFDRTTKRRLLPIVRRGENRFASMDVWQHAAINFMPCMLFVLILAITLFFFADAADNIGRLISLYLLYLFSGFPDWSAFTGSWIFLWLIYAAIYGLLFVLASLAAFFLIKPVAQFIAVCSGVKV
jgi:hypothetical protein